MSITIERKNEGKKNEHYEANTPNEKGLPYRSVNGAAWLHQSGSKPDNTRLEELRAAFFAYLDTPSEPQRAKVGDWVKVLEDFPQGSKCVKVNEYKVLDREGDGVKLLPLGGWVNDASYTIVPDPTPEREVFTGDPSTWGKGWYREVLNGGEYGSGIIVSEDGGYVWVGEAGSTNSSAIAWRTHFKYHRISDNPADGVKLDGGEG